LDYHWDFSYAHEEVVRRFADVPAVSVLKSPSLAAAKQFEDASLDFVYLDACHEEASVAADIKAWLPKVKVGGVLCGHDFTREWFSVVRAVLEAQTKHDWDLQTRLPDWWVIIEAT
jgi:hypothetical protein